MLPKVGALEAEANPNPPTLAAAVPSPKTFADVGARGVLKEGAAPNADAPPNDGEPPKAGGLPNTGALPKPPVLAGLKEPNPWAATLPTPVLKVPLGFGSPKGGGPVPNPKALAPLFPNRLLDPGAQTEGSVWLACPKPPVVVDPNGFLLAASSLGFPPL